MKFTTVAAAAIAATTFAMTAQADEIRATSSFGPKHVLATDGYPALFAKLEELTNGEWTGNDTASGLLAPNEMNAGLRDGISEMGPIILPYFAADYTEAGLVSELSVLGTDNRAISSAVTEYIATCEECVAEFKEAGHVFLGTDATTAYQFLSTKPIASLEDMEGTRVRTAGANFTRFVESLGGEPVQMPTSEVFEGLSSGVIDAAYASVAELKNGQLYDVVTDVTLIDQGVFNAAAMTNVSNMLWDRMSAEERQALAHAAQYAQTIAIDSWIVNTEESETNGKAQGINFIEPSDEMKAAGEAFVTEHLAALPTVLEERGISGAADKIARYQELLTKWEGLVANVSTAEELAELRYEEIWSKIDFATYGQ